MNEEIEKMFRRIELDKANDSCGFEFADGFGCTFDNIATCYDDRLKLYDLVKTLQSQLEQKEKQIKELEDRINKAIDFINAWKEEKVFKVSMIDLMQIEDFLKGDKE